MSLATHQKALVQLMRILTNRKESSSAVKFCGSKFRRAAHTNQIRRQFTNNADMGYSGDISPAIIQQVLIDLKMRLEHGYTCIITQCPKLNRAGTGSTNKSELLYINSTSGHFACQHCNKQGKWLDLKDNLLLLTAQKRRSAFQCFKDLDAVKPYIAEVSQAKDLYNTCMPLGALHESVSYKLLENFGYELIKTSVLDKYGVRCDPKLGFLVLPVIVNDQMISVKKVTCHSRTPDTVGSIRETFIPRATPANVFGLDTVSANVKEIVLCSNEIDAMTVYQETKKPAIALPRGFSSLPQEALPCLERFKTIVLWFGDNIQAWESAKLFAKKLNSKRCHIIRPSTHEPGPFTALTQGLRLSSILTKSRPITHESIVSFSHLRHEILSQLMHTEQVAGVKWRRFGTLNKLLKGHRRGELTVFTGPTGSGKTTFMSEYSLDLCMQGVNTLWGSFEINNARLGKMMLTQFAMKNLAKRLDLFDKYADDFQTLPMYFMTFHGQESLKKVIDAMSHAVYVHDIAHVIVDNLQFMMGVSASDWNDRFMKQDAIIAAFRKFATNMNCHEKESEDLTTASVFGTAKATQEADNVLILQDRRLTSVRGRKYIQVTKNRFDGELGIMLLKFDKDSLSFAAKDVKEKEKSVPKKVGMNEEDKNSAMESVKSFEEGIEDTGEDEL
ncbi:twinkle protein, mitochondrial [Plakobranchus ocellatus]|uniref:DNA 5'-3' helicase n=1 Tax=Plakobranchus ocellatus TaxID=259542 RepID=A0AAV4DFY4_9GAST|nr:twinkle protein, mitochondrial [Plakobranchus ocellatus]